MTKILGDYRSIDLRRDGALVQKTYGLDVQFRLGPAFIDVTVTAPSGIPTKSQVAATDCS